MSKKSRSEGNRVACAIKANKSEYYIADVDLEDDGDDVFACAKAVTSTLGKVKSSFMLISAGVKNLIVVVNNGNTDWLKESLRNVFFGENEPIIGDDFGQNEPVEKEGMIGYVFELECPFKLKDVVRSDAFSFLRKRGLLTEESEEEDNFEF